MNANFVANNVNFKIMDNLVDQFHLQGVAFLKKLIPAENKMLEYLNKFYSLIKKLS
jgi:hypothetical protein